MYDASGLSYADVISHRVDIILRMNEDEDIVDALTDGWVKCPEFEITNTVVTPQGWVRIHINRDIVVATPIKRKLGALLRGLLSAQRDLIKQREDSHDKYVR